MHEQQIAERARELPVEKQQEVLDFIDFLRGRVARGESIPVKGSLKHLNIDFSEEDIRELRREMWGNFPPDHPAAAAPCR